MDFDVWFESRLPAAAFPDYMGALREGFREIARDAWEAGFQAGEDHMRELERLDEYDRSVFGTDEYSNDW